jgi:hypothetical protein
MKRQDMGMMRGSEARHVIKDGVQVDAVIPADDPRRVRPKHQGKGSGRLKALDLLRQRGVVGATAMDVGISMIAGTCKRAYLGKAEIEDMGLRTGTALVRQGMASVTKGNRFVLKCTLRTLT